MVRPGESSYLSSGWRWWPGLRPIPLNADSKSVRASPRQILLPSGFLFSGTACGIKASGRLDLGCAEVPEGAAAAALFTRNRVIAAPLEVGRAHLGSAARNVRAVIVNSGNANCATGARGLRDCRRICQRAARLLSASAEEIFPSSTGIIGVPLPTRNILRALPRLLSRRAASAQSVLRFAQAIMTTDTRPKLAGLRFHLGQKTATLLGVAKGAGMIHPQLQPATGKQGRRRSSGLQYPMPQPQAKAGASPGAQLATMLVYLFTDVSASPRELEELLQEACDQTFHCISIDHDTSTNDTVLLVASGASGISLQERGARPPFAAALLQVCRSLAEQIVADGEGVQHVVRLRVEQARSRAEALRAARAIAGSSLVKTAWAGADPNWGRILAAIGNSGLDLDPRQVNIFFGGQQVCRGGVATRFDARRAHRYLSRPSYEVRVQLGRGHARLQYLTCDLTEEYVRINAEYST